SKLELHLEIAMKACLTAALIILLVGCTDEIVAPVHVACVPFLLEYGVAVGDTTETPVELRYIDIAPGDGTAASPGVVVEVNYSGYLLDGTPFDSSCPATRAAYRVLVGGVGTIPGFELGIRGMRPGGVRRVIIPP